MDFKENYNYKGWPNCIKLSNDEIELIITTDIGPRIIKIGYIGEQNMFREFEEQQGKTGGEEYRLYGGTRFWHGPEAYQRCYYPDNNPVKYQWNGKSLTLLQDKETNTGMQKEVMVSLANNNNSVNIIYRIHNRNLWNVKLAPWILSIMNLGGRGIIPQEPFQSWEERLAPVRPLVLWSYTTMDDPRWIWGRKYIQLKQNSKAETRQKLGVLNTLGWAAYYLNKQIFIKRYKYESKVEYTDFGVNTEIYTDANIFEVETLAAFEEIEPDHFSEHKENWYLFKSIVEEDEKSIDDNLLSLIGRTEVPKI